MNTAFLSCFFLSAIIATTLASPTANESLLDVDGQYVIAGDPYFFLPVRNGSGGGLQLAETGNETCSLTVVLSPYEIFPGLPITLTLPESRFTDIVSLNTELGIAFLGVGAPTSFWKVGKESSPIASPVDVDLQDPWGNCCPFRVQKHGNGYKLVYNSSSDAKYQDIGITIDDNGNKRLVVGYGETLIVQFKSAKSIRSSGIRSIV